MTLTQRITDLESRVLVCSRRMHRRGRLKNGWKLLYWKSVDDLQAAINKLEDQRWEERNRKYGQLQVAK